MITRRGLLAGTMAASASLVARRAEAVEQRPRAPIRAPEGFLRVHTPNGWTLPHELVDGVKVFHLVAERNPAHEFAPGLVTEVWGYNGGSPGPTIEAVEGDRVRIFVTNRLPEPTTVHWHGMDFIPSGMDGPAGLNQPPIPVNETFVYELTLGRPGTFLYHSHFDEMVQINLGMMGFFIVHPRRSRRQVERDFAIMLMEWAIPAGTSRPNPFEMTEFNVFTMNSKVFPATEPLVVGLGDRVRIRFGNLSSVDHHPIHFHGLRFWVTATDGGEIPESARWPETSVLVPVGTTRDIEFVANNPGDWAIHCHMTHHFMNQMGHGAPNTVGARLSDLDDRIRKLIPGYMTMGEDGMGGMGEHAMPVPENSIPMLGGAGPFGFIDMGGMFTILKVRAGIGARAPDDVGWYEHPPGTVARPATLADLSRGRVDVKSPPRNPAAGPLTSPPPPAHGPEVDPHGGH